MPFVNRFSTVQNLSDLLDKINTNNIVFRTLSSEEIERINSILSANLPDVEFKVTNSISFEKMLGMLNHIINKEGNNMSNVSKSEIKTNLNLATQELFGKLEAAKKAVKVEAGQTYEQYVDKVDDSLNIVKGAFGQALDFIDKQLGFTVLKHNILGIIESGKNIENPKKWSAMAKTCRDQVDAFIYKVETLGDPTKAKKLKELIGTMEDEDIFTKFFTTIKYITEKVTEKLRKWFKIDDEKSVVGAIARSIVGFAGLLKAGLQIVWSAAGFVVSFIVAGAIQIANWIVNAVHDLCSKFKDWDSKKNEPVPMDEELKDDDEK